MLAMLKMPRLQLQDRVRALVVARLGAVELIKQHAARL